jgi:hypothetical protein
VAASSITDSAVDVAAWEPPPRSATATMYRPTSTTARWPRAVDSWTGKMVISLLTPGWAIALHRACPLRL